MTITITANQVREVLEVLSDGWGDDPSFRPDYSGRGMYGATCAGFVHTGSAFRLGLALGNVLGDDAYDLRAEEDSMGLSNITYFRGLKLADGETWDDEEW